MVPYENKVSPKSSKKSNIIEDTPPTGMLAIEKDPNKNYSQYLNINDYTGAKGQTSSRASAQNFSEYNSNSARGSARGSKQSFESFREETDR